MVQRKKCAYVFILNVLMFGFVFYILYIFILHGYGPFCSYCCVQFITKVSGKKKIFVFGVSSFWIKCMKMFENLLV